MIIPRIKCEICGKEFKSISHTHTLKEHGMTLKEYMAQFPDAPIHREQVEVDESNLLLDGLKRQWSK